MSVASPITTETLPIETLLKAADALHAEMSLTDRDQPHAKDRSFDQGYEDSLQHRAFVRGIGRNTRWPYTPGTFADLWTG